MSALADRIRGIVGAPGRVASAAQGLNPAPPAGLQACATAALETALGGMWRESAGARCFVVERRMEPSRRH